MTALIDADSLLYKIGFAIEDKTVWNEWSTEEPQVTYEVELDACYDAFDSMIENIMFATETDELLLVFTGKKNFRMDLPISYKANREGTRKPEAYKPLLEYALKKYPCKMVDYMEADDYVVYQKIKYPDEYFLCAIDKDVLYQTPGIHYNYHSDSEVEIEEFDAIRYAYYQTLAGDPTDGYKGCKGIGPVKAQKALADCKDECELWTVVVDLYIKKGHEYSEAVWNMRLANMRQFNGTQIEYWQPPCKTEHDGPVEFS